MPSSLLFAGLVATWLAVLVPMTARKRQPMHRPSDAALASRVLERPARPSRTQDGEDVEQPRYRRGRGGYDPEAAELAARARYTFRRRAVLTLVVLALASAGAAAWLTVPQAWWVHGGADLALVLYLVNLRRQVRLENAIRSRRSARSAGSRVSRAAADTDQHPVDTDSGAAPDDGSHPGPRADSQVDPGDDRAVPDKHAPLDDHLDYATHLVGPRTPGDGAADGRPSADDGRDQARGAGPARTTPVTPDVPALPRLPVVPLPSQPVGTVRLEIDDEDPELHELDYGRDWGYRRAAG